MLKLSDLDFKEAQRMYFFKTMPTVITEEIEFRNLDGEKAFFEPTMELFYCEHLIKNSKDKYKTFSNSVREPFLVTKSQLDKLNQIEDNVYVYLSFEVGNIWTSDKNEVTDCLLCAPLVFTAGTHIIRTKELNYWCINTTSFNSMYSIKEVSV